MAGLKYIKDPDLAQLLYSFTDERTYNMGVTVTEEDPNCVILTTDKTIGYEVIRDLALYGFRVVRIEVRDEEGEIAAIEVVFVRGEVAVE